MEYYYSKINSPVGILHMVSNTEKLMVLLFDNNWTEFCENFEFELISKKNQVLRDTEKQLKEYFLGSRKEFDIPLEFSGTAFQKQAWKTLQQIPFGKTISYAQQALKMKNPKAVRAVGGANGKNNICIIVPCHRVIGKNGSLTGFGGGINIKKQLLQLENSL
ncbi:MAG: methylated-DNA--[protein]-cysteine S-methyltransferase [Bdellovibrionota bacterium]